MDKIALYDSTLRDGAQGEGVSFSVQDKLGIAAKLDDLGVDYIEGGYTLSNPKDRAFFQEAGKVRFAHSRLTAFGSTRRGDVKCEDDAGLHALLESEVGVLTVVGKAWDLHVRDILRVSLEENLRMIADSVAYLVKRGREVIYDAEHFYDGYKHNADYAMKTILAAAEAGAHTVVLCDTNGGSLPAEVGRVTGRVTSKLACAVGFHGHNDGGLAVANSLAAVEAGASHVQGTINGLGERTGNADLCQIIPNLSLKMHKQPLPESKLGQLTETSRYVYEIANFLVPAQQPFVGPSAFAHKGGLHVDAMLKNPLAYEHIKPELVGNERRMLVSELAGSATVLSKLDKLGVPHTRQKRREIVQRIKHLESEGYQFEAAEASFELLVKRMTGLYRPFFDLHGFRVMVQKNEAGQIVTEATVKLSVDGDQELSASEGNGPVNALDSALRRALERFYPSLSEARLVDYKVRVINTKAGTAAKVRVFIESRDGATIWGTVGVSENIIEASWRALVDSVEYKLSRDAELGR